MQTNMTYEAAARDFCHTLPSSITLSRKFVRFCLRWCI